MNENVKKTGTTTVGIVAKDSIILAADKRATAGTFVADRKVDKIIPIHDNMVITTAGVVSDIQLIIKIIKAELALKSIRASKKNKIKEAANLTASLVYSNIRRISMIPGLVHFLFAGYDEDGCHLYDIYPDGSLSKVSDYVSTGSGSMLAFGVLESQYKKDMPEDQAIELILKAINTAIQRDTATGEGIDVYVVRKAGIEKVMTKTIQTVVK